MENKSRCHSCDAHLTSDECSYGLQECEKCELRRLAERIYHLLEKQDNSNEFVAVFNIIITGKER